MNVSRSVILGEGDDVPPLVMDITTYSGMCVIQYSFLLDTYRRLNAHPRVIAFVWRTVREWTARPKMSRSAAGQRCFGTRTPAAAKLHAPRGAAYFMLTGFRHRRWDEGGIVCLKSDKMQIA